MLLRELPVPDKVSWKVESACSPYDDKATDRSTSEPPMTRASDQSKLFLLCLLLAAAGIVFTPGCIAVDLNDESIRVVR